MSRPLIVALHGVGATAPDLAAALAPLQDHADLVALDGAERFHAGGAGRQWFSIVGVTEANRPARVTAALPPLLTRLDAIATDRGVARDDLVLLGFSQGAIMTLAAVAGGHHRGRTIAIAGRLAAPAVAVTHPARVLLVHDRADAVMPASLSVDAASALQAAGHQVAGTWTRGLGHRIGAPTLAAISAWLLEPALSPLGREGWDEGQSRRAQSA